MYLRGWDTDGSDLSATQDWPDTERLLGSANVVPEALQRFARAAADFATHGKLGKLEFARDAHGRPDVSAFDFTSMMRAESSALICLPLLHFPSHFLQDTVDFLFQFF